MNFDIGRLWLLFCTGMQDTGFANHRKAFSLQIINTHSQCIPSLAGIQRTKEAIIKTPLANSPFRCAFTVILPSSSSSCHHHNYHHNNHHVITITLSSSQLARNILPSCISAMLKSSTHHLMPSNLFHQYKSCN